MGRGEWEYRKKFTTSHSPFPTPYLWNGFGCASRLWSRFFNKQLVRNWIDQDRLSDRDFDAGKPREQFLILIRNLLPVVKLNHARHGAAAVFADDRGIMDDVLQVRGQIGGRFVDDAGVADDFQIFRSVQSQGAIAGAHRFDQRRVGASDLGGVDVTVCVLL